jgi:hypothetical protein
MLYVDLMNVVILNVVILNVVMLNAVAMRLHVRFQQSDLVADATHLKTALCC